MMLYLILKTKKQRHPNIKTIIEICDYKAWLPLACLLVPHVNCHPPPLVVKSCSASAAICEMRGQVSRRIQQHSSQSLEVDKCLVLFLKNTLPYAT